MACWTVMPSSHFVLKVLRKDGFQSLGDGDSRFYKSVSFVSIIPEEL